MPPNIEIFPIGSDDSQRRHDDGEKIVGYQSYDLRGRGRTRVEHEEMFLSLLVHLWTLETPLQRWGSLCVV
ncbi:hypothetical protein MPTK1_4g16270 [Marchantia polymorpha subsp. ruderalis]|uniref:Uncharacterized protein n=2 Tax=Marchantia polymorpha TaxID=3197 RepID=A0AAF6BAG3_MARPO|nr:hypothetical protein MARPO_0054s0093 [Marchantia polymorpha]BBN08997.1 hypothetical protein Mp_4g16270 [Marchantia polymorpha subsp. ruderalis]|eukprot:PTQ37986.1 hypothetical protein MARPO_0054s0093 [Marchantia polymorpha]